MEHKPEESPFFSHWEYKSKFHERLKVGDRKAYYHVDMPLAEVNKWADRVGNDVMLGFVDSNPNIEVTVEEDGEMKTITLPAWARDRERLQPQSYYSKSPWVFRCVDIKAKAFSGIEWAIYPSDPEKEEVEELPDDNDAVALLREINPEDNWNDIASKISKDLDIYGLGYIAKLRKKEGEVQGTEGAVLLLKRLNPSTVKVMGDENGISHFEQQLGVGKIIKHERENILYFRDYDPDNDIGSISPLQTCIKNVKIEISADSHLNDFFDNNAQPSLVMSTPDAVQDDVLKRLTGAWKREFGGKGNKGKTAFMSHGYEPKMLSYPLNQMALKEIREEARKSICAAFGVPPVLAGAWEAANFATAEIGQKSLYTETIIPRARYIAGVINAELMNEFDNVFFRFEFSKLEVLQEDMGSRAEWMSLLVETRILKPEVAAVGMGFTEEDVPEPMPEPTLTPQNEQESDSEQSSKAGTALRKFRKKAVNRVKDGRNPKCEFRTENVPEGTINAIKAQLDGLEQASAVHAVFDAFEG